MPTVRAIPGRATVARPDELPLDVGGPIRRSRRIRQTGNSWACAGMASGFMRNSCVILRQQFGQSAVDASLTTVWSEYASSCCSIQGRSQGESDRTARERGSYQWTIYFPAAADVRFTDRLTGFSGPVGLVGRMLEVVGFGIDNAGLGAYLKIQAVEVAGNTTGATLGSSGAADIPSQIIGAIPSGGN